MHTFLVSLLLWLSSRFKIRLGPFCPCPMARPWAYRGNVEEGTYSLTEKFNISFAPLLSILLDVCFLLFSSCVLSGGSSSSVLHISGFVAANLLRTRKQINQHVIYTHKVDTLTRWIIYHVDNSI